MSDNTSVIREFLVRLGFKTDETALKKFTTGIDTATKTVVGLATAIETTALAVSAGVARFASNLEALYFASQKTGASALNLKAFDKAAQNLGASAGEALESVQGLARFLRNNPGGEGFLRGLGINTRDANGQLRDTTDLLLEMSKKFQSQPYYLAKQYADVFGISEDTLRAMRSGDFGNEVARMRDQLKDAGFDKASADAHQFMIDLRDLSAQLEIFGLQIYDSLVKRVGGGLKELTAWLRENGPAIADRIADILNKLLDLAEKLGPALAWIVDEFIKLDAATDGWSTKLLGLLGVLKLFGGAEIIGGILKLGGALTRAVGGAVGGPLVGAVGAGLGLGWAIDKYFPNNPLAKLGGNAAGWLWDLLHHDQVGGSAKEIADYLESRGYSHDQAAGMAANILAESNGNPNAVGDHGQAYGLAQWHPDRQAAFKQYTGRDIRNSTTQDQLDFMIYELQHGSEQRANQLLLAAKNAQQAGEVMSLYYERPAAGIAEAQRRGNAAVQIAQETNIHISTTDPVAAGRAAAGEQSRVNSDLARNMHSAVN